MSASSIADRAAPADPLAEPDPSTVGSTAKDALASIAAYIPSEGIALYIAIASLGLAAKVDYWNWVALGLALVANGFVFSLRFAQKSIAIDGSIRWGRLFYLLAVTGSLTAVYVSAIAGNPWASTSNISALVSGTLVVILAFLVPFIAPLIGLEATTPSPAPATVQPLSSTPVPVRVKKTKSGQ